jgi:hypothetical protein
MEKITHEDHDETAWVCLCGNTPDSDGFAPATQTALRLNPR